MPETRKWSLKELCASFCAEYPDHDYGPYSDDIDGLVGSFFYGPSKWGVDYLVVFERDGKLWGLIDDVHPEMGSSLKEDYGLDGKIECREVKKVVKVEYDFA